MICNGKEKVMVGPEGIPTANGTGLILLNFTVPLAPRNGPKGINGLRAECPTIRSGFAIRPHRLESARLRAGTNSGTPGERPGNIGTGEGQKE